MVAARAADWGRILQSDAPSALAPNFAATAQVARRRDDVVAIWLSDAQIKTGPSECFAMHACWSADTDLKRTYSQINNVTRLGRNFEITPPLRRHAHAAA